jgi:hypothetical protein
LATKNDGEKITELRLKAYQTASTAKVLKPEIIVWSQIDEHNYVLVLEDDQGCFISTQRAQIVGTREDAEAVLDIVCPQNLSFPLLILEKASTVKPMRKHGLNTILKLVFIRAALKAEIQQILVTINAGTTRITLLEKFGFIFTVADLSQRTDSAYQNKTPVMLGSLKRIQFTSAIATAESEYQNQLRSIEIDKALENIF